eukprot:1161132-Pelagomonas_calceolata.AAC.7
MMGWEQVRRRVQNLHNVPGTKATIQGEGCCKAADMPEQSQPTNCSFSKQAYMHLGFQQSKPGELRVRAEERSQGRSSVVCTFGAIASRQAEDIGWDITWLGVTSESMKRSRARNGCSS